MTAGICIECNQDRTKRRGSAPTTQAAKPAPLSQEDFIIEYLRLHGEGYTRLQIASRLGMHRDTVDSRLQRAARAGDTRVPYTPRGKGKPRAIAHDRSVRTDSWVDRAACKGMDTNAFFPHDEADADRWAAKRICARCPVKAECLEVALARNEQGIWGGTTTKERQRLRAGRAV